jgi:hypothetical protein
MVVRVMGFDPRCGPAQPSPAQPSLARSGPRAPGSPVRPPSPDPFASFDFSHAVTSLSFFHLSLSLPGRALPSPFRAPASSAPASSAARALPPPRALPSPSRTPASSAPVSSAARALPPRVRPRPRRAPPPRRPSRPRPARAPASPPSPSAAPAPSPAPRPASPGGCAVPRSDDPAPSSAPASRAPASPPPAAFRPRPRPHALAQTRASAASRHVCLHDSRALGTRSVLSHVRP